MEEEFLYFWHGPFNQWYLSPFKDTKRTYNCAEQYMMAQKARLFNDEEIFHKIMNTISPKIQKSLGRKVKNFDEEIWEKEAKNIVYKGNYLKFTQNNFLYRKLINTAKPDIYVVLVEASPYDKVWGIGLTESDPMAKKKETWNGTNWLGEVLTELRDELISGSDE